MACKAPSRACFTGLAVAFKPLAVFSSTLSWSMRLIELSFQSLTSKNSKPDWGCTRMKSG